jgi:hypothetical protein
MNEIRAEMLEEFLRRITKVWEMNFRREISDQARIDKLNEIWFKEIDKAGLSDDEMKELTHRAMGIPDLLKIALGKERRTLAKSDDLAAVS